MTAVVDMPELDSPTAHIACSRIGASVVPDLSSQPKSNPPVIGVTASGLSVLQYAETVDFAPNAVAQLWCVVQVTPSDGAALQTLDQTEEVLTEGFQSLGNIGPQPGGLAGLFDPSSTEFSTASVLESTFFFEGNEDPFAEKWASWFTYDHMAGGQPHEMTLVSHLGQQGS